MVTSRKALLSVLLSALLAFASADVYFHNPRGQNDRCDEKSNNRNNEQRMYNSNNNAAGGYGTCDQTMFFYEDTLLRIEWYAQHACGNGAQVKTDPSNPEIVTCEYVLQLGCAPDMALYAGSNQTNYQFTDGISLGRPGADQYNTVTQDSDKFNTFGDTCTETHPTTATCLAAGTSNAQATCATLNLADAGNRNTFNSASCQCHPRKLQTYGSHEPEAFWLACQARERNKGLFTADQNVNNNGGATRTRQEPNSQRYGYECPEERDYWPYWHPTPWRDLAVLTSDTTQCSDFLAASQNTNTKCQCIAATGSTSTQAAEAQTFNQQLFCANAGYTWDCSSTWNWKKPDCILAPASSDNALGKIDMRGANTEHTDGQRMAHYDWNVDGSLIPSGADSVNCLLRLRYNMSTYEVTRQYDQTNNNKVSDNPVMTIGGANQTAPSDQAIPLRMAINTAQYGRTFEDRTYIFQIRKRPTSMKGKTIHNFNVRGKRGNIAQVRNCVEYDFIPNVLEAGTGDYVHFQWCGTDYNDNGNAGEGRDGTDRSNIVSIANFARNVVVPLNSTTTVFSTADLQALSWIGQDPSNCFSTHDMLTTQKNNADDPKSCHFLNGPRDSNGMPTAYFNYVAKVVKNGVFQFMSSRNNNSTNRSQKGQISVGTSSLSGGAIAGIVIGSVAGAAAVGAGAFFIVKKGGLSFSRRV